MISYTFRHHTPSDTKHLGFPGGAAAAMDGPDALQLAVHAALVVVVYYCRTYVKAVREGGSEERKRVLWDATSRGLCGRVGLTH